ncbi:hypothetical protein KFL_004040060 [Klebsormidium nitens]|uniref:Uncharacterized protein n=1 Tax=Klebsormidium nitens TaxID=105231 RepID=A0A1Y1IHD7_KLENI|nr:hypothetical protein KFL_004040060 [Klebsormidium nitens]|eukprot:GAQ88146.1 hypothetical protein KFL_004040060 [Klebsormidium nitens]
MGAILSHCSAVICIDMPVRPFAPPKSPLEDLENKVEKRGRKTAGQWEERDKKKVHQYSEIQTLYSRSAHGQAAKNGHGQVSQELRGAASHTGTYLKTFQVLEPSATSMESIRVTDDEIVVDSMILASRGEKENPALPSFGRSLVPYFCPNRSDNPTEDDINIKTDLDAYRRDGASILDIPSPEASKEPASKGAGFVNAGPLVALGKSSRLAAESHSMTGSEPLKMRKRGAGAKSRKAGPRKSEEVSSPTSPLDDPTVLTTSSDSDATDSDSQQKYRSVFVGQGPTWQQEELQKSPLKAKKRAPKPHSKGASASLSGAPKGSVKTSQPQPEGSSKGQTPSALPQARQDVVRAPQVSVEARSQPPERFAGAAFHNSPAPSCLPLPTFALQKVQDSSAPARLNLFLSPPREPRGPPPPHAGLLTPPCAPTVRGGLLTSGNAPLLRAPSTPEQLLTAAGGGPSKGLQVSAEQATLALQELLKLGTPPPAPVSAPLDLSESSIATRDLRRLLQLA